ncbi:hypothetical protein ACOSQ4_004085 [Xanthoceras sorbifolium]
MFGYWVNVAKLDWCSLPEGLLNLIGKYLDTRIDILRFRAVCTTFRSSTSLPSKITSPYTSLNLPVPVDQNPQDGDHLLLTETTVYAMQPLNETIAWLVEVQETSSGELKIMDLLCCKGELTETSNYKFPSILNLLDYRVKQISKYYGFELISIDDDVYVFMSKVLVSKCLDKIDDGFAVTAIHRNELILWRNGYKNWTPIDFGFQDIVYYNEQFYAVDRTGLAVIVDYSKSLKITKIALRPMLNRQAAHNMIFVEICKDLFLIDSFSFRLEILYKFDTYACEFNKDDLSSSISANACSDCKENWLTDSLYNSDIMRIKLSTNKIFRVIIIFVDSRWCNKLRYVLQ